MGSSPFPVFLSRVCVPPFFSARVSPLFLFSILYPSASRPENVPSRAAEPRCVFSPVGSLIDLSLISSVGIYLPSNSPALTRFSVVSAGLRRRRSMDWKAFAPRYMPGAIEFLCVDVAVLVGLWRGVGRIVSCITRVFALPAPRASSSSGSTEGQQSEKNGKI